jgi:hypothetical protein
MKRGTIFEHKHWLDTKNMPLLCQVTATGRDVVYWAAYDPNNPHPKGKSFFHTQEIPKYVGQILEEPK